MRVRAASAMCTCEWLVTTSRRLDGHWLPVRGGIRCPDSADAVTHAFTDHVAAAGLRPIVLHGLRHTHITLGLAAGVPVKVMQERTGHAKVETTLAYMHILTGMQEQAAETMERAIFER